MKIAVLGTAVVGQTLAGKLAELGHQVSMGTRNVVDALAKTAPDNFGRPPLSEWVKQNQKVNVAAFSDAAKNAEIIIVATNGLATIDALELAGKENLAGKVIVDVSNPLDFSKGFPPSLFVCNTDSLAEQIQRKFPVSRVVKSLNTMTASIMVNPSLVPGDHTVFLSSNDDEAKNTVRELLGSFGWKENNMIDLGDITTARGAEQLLPIWVRLYGSMNSPMFNFHIVKAQ